MWKKRKRESSNRRLKHDEEDDADEDDDEIDGEDDGPNPVQDHHVPVDIPPSDCEREVLLDGGDRISSFPLAVRRTVTRTHSSVKAMAALERTLQRGDAKKQQQTDVVVENISYGQVQAFSAVPSDGGASQTSDLDRSDGCGASAVLLSPPPMMEGRGVEKRMGKHLYVLPVHAEWFSETSVHRLERQVVPHFFSGRSTEHTPEKYMDLRNWIVGRYMEDKGRRLGISDFQGADTGVDRDDLIRIFRFLDHWGIINYCASDTCREAWSMESYLREDFNWEVHVPSAALRSIDSLIHFDKPKCRLKPSDVYTYPSRGVDISNLDDKIRERLSEHRCSHCSRPIPVVYYQSQKEVDTLLCLDCFGEGRLVLGHSSLDFVKTETTQEYDDIYGENWTDQETLLLLEAMEIYSDNWNEIAEHVGTKSKPQCILHFIRMPMEGGFFENIHLPVVPTTTTTTEDPVKIKDSAGSLHGPDSENRIPFENSGNPVMYLVAFLASVVGPRVAAACAHASLVVLSEQEEIASHQNTKDGPEIGNRFLNGESKGPSLSPEKVKAAAKAGLSAAGMKAKLFSDHEEREIQRLSANIVNNQLKRVELKLKRFTDVETLLLKESEQVERARLRFSAERLHILSTRFGQPGLGQPGLGQPGFGIPGAAPLLMNMGGARQPAAPQPGISGMVGNSWPSYDRQIPSQIPLPLRHHHHHHHQMFAGGQRIPLNTVNSMPLSSVSPSGIPLRPVSTTTLGLT